MEKNFGLSYLDALTKTHEIVKRDIEHIKAPDEGEFNAKDQVENLRIFYTEIDPDTTFHTITSIESNKSVMRNEINFAIKMSLVVNPHQPQRHLNIVDGIRFKHLLEKYSLKRLNIRFQLSWNFEPVAICFPDEEYAIKKENPSLGLPQPDGMKKFKNFRREYNVIGIFGLLPSGKKYGGFVKAFIHLQLLLVSEELGEMFLFGKETFQFIVSKFRIIYNSTIFSNQKRVEWFEKLQIKESDCALWTQLFDKQYPGYKDIHKFFGQIA